MANENDVKESQPAEHADGKKREKISKYFAYAPIHRLIKDQDVETVAEDAVTQLMTELENFAVKTIAKAKEAVAHAKRKRLTAEDISFAIK